MEYGNEILELIWNIFIPYYFSLLPTDGRIKYGRNVKGMVEKMKETKLSNEWKYVISTYIVFTMMVLGICGVASMVFHASPMVMRILSNVCAWSPTIVLFAGFKRWCSNMNIKTFMKRAFGGKVRVGLLIISALSTGMTFFVSAYIYALVKDVSFDSIFLFGTTPVMQSVLLSLLSGPTGEECGWRGYLRYEFVAKHGFLKGNLLVGLVWTFWHAVLWVVDSDYTSGVEVAIYVISNVIVITAMHMIMAVVLEYEDNLIYAIIIHFCFNLPYCFLDTDIIFYIIIIPLYVVVACFFLGYRKLHKRQHNGFSKE